MDELDRRPGNGLEEYIKRLENSDTEVMNAEQRKRLRDALNRARAAQRRQGSPKPPRTLRCRHDAAWDGGSDEVTTPRPSGRVALSLG